MAHLYGTAYTRDRLLAHIGDISQVARIKPYRLIEGKEDGVLALDVSTGSGLQFSVLASRGMDISSASFNGRSLAWRSATTDAHPAYFDHEGENGRGWLRSFYGGLVITCGLSWVGANDQEAGSDYGIHGRVSNLPANNVQWDAWWEGDEYVMEVRGVVREATVFGENIEMRRAIRTHLGSRHLTIRDTVANLGYKTCDHMILYHINLGFPVVNDTSRLIAPTLNMTPRDADAIEKQDRYRQMQPPQSGYRETVYFHDLATNTEGQTATAVVNESIEVAEGAPPGLGVYCRFRPQQLPRFIEWKMMDAGTYVVGMEPANCSVMGRPHERAQGTLQRLEPGESRQYEVEIGVLAGGEEIRAFESACNEAVDAVRRENAAS